MADTELESIRRNVWQSLPPLMIAWHAESSDWGDELAMRLSAAVVALEARKFEQSEQAALERMLKSLGDVGQKCLQLERHRRQQREQPTSAP
jgi:hypothetical protein